MNKARGIYIPVSDGETADSILKMANVEMEGTKYQIGTRTQLLPINRTMSGLRPSDESMLNYIPD